MKKWFIITFLLIILIMGILFFYHKEKNKIKIPELPVQKETLPPIVLSYVDHNNTKIGLYVQNGNEKRLVKEYLSNWDAESIMGIFYAVFTTEYFIPGTNYKNVWNKYSHMDENVSSYKIGYCISFTMNHSEEVKQRILDPNDAYLMYPKLQFYLYDDVHLDKGKPYYHVTQETVTRDTIYTSVKIVGDTRTKEITSDIVLQVFTYDGMDDFSENGDYRGNSQYTIILKKK